MVHQGAFGVEFPAAVGLLCGCPAFMSSFRDVYGPGGKGGDEWLEVSHHVNPARQLQFTVQSPCRTCRGCHPALPSREHMFILRTSRGKSVDGNGHLLAIPLMGMMEVSFLHH